MVTPRRRDDCYASAQDRPMAKHVAIRDRGKSGLQAGLLVKRLKADVIAARTASCK